MWRRYALVLAVLCVPGVLSAQEKLDHLLPAGSQVYLRWDGVTAHKADADKLAVMKMWKGETGHFLRSLWSYLSAVGKEALAAELKADLAGALFDEFGGLVESVADKGFTLGAELQSIDPLKMQVTLIFPDGVGPTKSPLSFMNLVSRLDKSKQIKTAKHGKRDIHYFHAEPIYMAWWPEGTSTVWTIGTTEPTTLLKEMENQKEGLSAKAVYKDVQGFKEFPVWMRGYLELPSLLRLAGKGQPAVNQIVESLGVDTIQSMTFFSGFDGPAERAVAFTNLSKGPRKGILKIYTGKNFCVKDLPPMPPDLHGFSAASIDLGAGYEVAVDFLGTLVKTLAPFGAPDIKQSIKDFEQNNKINIADIFGTLDPLYVAYADSAEGFLGLGQTQLFKVKNEKKLEEDLGKILQLAQINAGGLVTATKSNYHGATIHRLGISDPGTGNQSGKIYYTIHKGWLALAQYPQPLKGFILRANGALPVWKASPELEAKLKAFPGEFSAITISDPRPTVKLVLSILPPLIDYGTLALENAKPFGGKLANKHFDIGLIPNAHEATKHLFPNITITTMQGDSIRTETRSSLMLPF